MMCAKPYIPPGSLLELGCGVCAPCLMNRRRLWIGRLVLEAQKHQFCYFVTLTYSDEFVPYDTGSWSPVPRQMTLRPSDYQKWLKRLRKEVGNVRYFLVGEYGDRYQRPHYHAALFGVDLSSHSPEENCSCVLCRTWGMGICDVGSFTPQSAGYICGYVTKSMTKRGDPRLNGRYPEFARMSLKPGIGGEAVHELAEFSTSLIGARHLAATADVPSVFSFGSNKYPLGRYLRGRLRLAIGMASSAQPPDASRQWQMEEREKLLRAGYREERKAKRIQTNRRAMVLHSIAQSKKGAI